MKEKNEDLFSKPDKPKKTGKKQPRRCNNLNGREWLRNSISVWNDIKKAPEERALKHPALFPIMLAERLINCFTTEQQRYVLDPFCGSGSTLIAATNLGKCGIGFELSAEYVKLARDRLKQDSLVSRREYKIYETDARTLSKHIDSESIDFTLTSPPYWDILNQKRTADYKQVRNYGDFEDNLGHIEDYDEFNDELKKVWAEIYKVMKVGSYFIINVMDLRKGPNFYPFHLDVSRTMQSVGFIFDDMIIWDRRADYSNLRALGYPSVFRINKIHEFLLIFKKSE